MRPAITFFNIQLSNSRLHFFWKHKKEYGEKTADFIRIFVKQFPVWLKKARMKQPAKEKSV